MFNWVLCRGPLLLFVTNLKPKAKLETPNQSIEIHYLYHLRMT